MIRCLAACDGGAAELREVDGLLEHVAGLEALVVDARLLERRSRALGSVDVVDDRLQEHDA